jgi:hypothetical protein
VRIGSRRLALLMGVSRNRDGTNDCCYGIGDVTGSQRRSQSGRSEEHQPGDPQFVGRQLGEASRLQSGCGYWCRRALVDLLPAARDFESV